MEFQSPSDRYLVAQQPHERLARRTVGDRIWFVL